MLRLSLTLLALSASTAAAQPLIGDGWTYERERDAFTDDLSTRAYTMQTDGLDRVRIEVACNAFEGLSASVSFPEFIAYEGADVRYRVDRGALAEESWTAKNGDGATLMAADPANFAYRLISGRKLFIEARKLRGEPSRISLGVARGDNEIYRVMRDCGYYADRWVDDTPLVGDSIGAAFEPEDGPGEPGDPDNLPPRETRDVVIIVRDLWPFGRDGD